jgi:signal peptidase II
MPRLRRPLLIVAVALAVIASDQLAKTWALHHLVEGRPRHIVGTLWLSLQFNTGIAFSQATGSTALVTVIALCVVAVLLVVAHRTHGTYAAVVMGLIIGGAGGNLVDRLVRHHGGAVIDFVDPRFWPVFNLADAAVSIGVVLALGQSLLGSRRVPSEVGGPS